MAVKDLNELKEQLRIQQDVAKKAKYKVKNADGGYDLIHFETSADQVVTTPEKQFVSALEKTTYADKYTKSEVDDKVSTINGKITNLERADANFAEKISALEASVGEGGATTGKIEAVQSALDDYKSKNDKKVLALEAKVDEDISNLNTLNGNLVKEDQRLAGLISQNDSAIRQNASDISGLDGRLTILDAEKTGKIAKIEEKLKTMETVSDQAVQALGNKVSTLEEQMSTVNEKVGTLESGLQTTNSNVAGLTRRVENVEGAVADIQSTKADKTHSHAMTDVTGLTAALASKASATHQHSIEDVTELQTKLNEKESVTGVTNKINAAKIEVNSYADQVAATAKADALKDAKSYADTKKNEAISTAKLYTDGKLAELVDSAPETLDTLKELSAALGDDPNFSTTILNKIGTKVDQAAYDTKIANLEEAIAKCSTSENMTTALSKKADKVYVDTELAKKVNTADYDLDKKALESSIAGKADKNETQNALNLKADKTTVQESLDLKADKTELSSAISGVNSTIATQVSTLQGKIDAKADKTYVDETFETIANVNKVKGEVAAVKATVQQHTSDIASKADAQATTEALSKKADAANVYTKTEVNQKFKDEVITVSSIQPNSLIWIEIAE